MRCWDSRKWHLVEFNCDEGRESFTEEMDYSSLYASSTEFIALLQEQARKLGDKKINCILWIHC